MFCLGVRKKILKNDPEFEAKRWVVERKHSCYISLENYILDMENQKFYMKYLRMLPQL